MKELISAIYKAVAYVLASFGITAEDNEFAWVDWVFTTIFG